MNGPANAAAAHSTVLRSFDEQCGVSPDLPAVEYRGRHLTYAQLAASADRLARRLTGLGVAGTVVGLAVDRSFHLPVAILGTLRAGAAYLPLDPEYPRARREFMLRDSGARVLLARPEAIDGLRTPAGIATILLDEDVTEGTAAGPELPLVTGEHLAYVLYTSGSTGAPKGVMMAHGPLANLIDWQRRRSACAQGSRTLQFSAVGFDASFQEMFGTWACGGCLVLVDDDVRRDPHRLLRFVDEQRIGRLFMPFVALQALANAAADQRRHPGSLREVITAGEQLFVTPALRSFFGAIEGAVLENHYGPTETHVVTALRLDPDPGTWPDLPAIGRPISGARIDVVDRRGIPVPIGTTGEIAIGGKVLANGYLDRPALTAQRFVADPLGPPGARRYLTGDLGRREADGRVHFLGREDGQVKIRGYRVELGEVEIAVKQLPELTDAVVVLNEQTGVGPRLVAYVITTSTSPVGDLRPRLAQTLPEHMVPVAVVALDRFPMTPSGKIDRRALAGREVRLTGTGTGDAEDNTVERCLLRLWEDVLAVTGVGIGDNFFSLGGDSLLAAVMTTRLNEEFAVRADLETFIRYPTVGVLSRWIREQHGAPAERTGLS